jgi:hypothetical protein
MAGGGEGFEALRLLLESGGPGWTVEHADGSSEPFDGGKFIASLIGAEVPTNVAIGLYGEFVEAAADRVEEDSIRLSDVRTLTTTLLMRLPEGDRSLWLSNYEHLVALDHSYPEPGGDERVDVRFIDASDSGALRAFLSDLVRERLQAAAAGDGVLRTAAIDDAVRRLTRIVRLCGFFRIPRAFLRELVDALAEHSSKLVFPDVAVDAEARGAALATADDLLGAAALYARSAEHRGSVGTALLLAVAPACTVFLQQYGFMPRIGPEHVLRQLAGVLEAGYARSRLRADQTLSLDTPSVLYQRVDAELATFGLSAQELLELSRQLLSDVGLSEGEAEPAGIASDETSAMDAITSARRLVMLVRVATGAAEELAAARDAMAGSIDDAAGAIDRLLRSFGFAPVAERHGWGASIGVPLGQLSPFGAYGSSLEIVVTDAAREMLGERVTVLVEHLRGREGAVGLIACTSLDPPSPGERALRVDPAMFKDLRRLAEGGEPIVVPVPASQLLRLLSRGPRFFDHVADSIRGTFPAIAVDEEHLGPDDAGGAEGPA